MKIPRDSSLGICSRTRTMSPPEHSPSSRGQSSHDDPFRKEEQMGEKDAECGFETSMQSRSRTTVGGPVEIIPEPSSFKHGKVITSQMSLRSASLITSLSRFTIGEPRAAQDWETVQLTRKPIEMAIRIIRKRSLVKLG